MRGFAICIFVAAWMANAASAETTNLSRLDVKNAKRAELNWMMNCQGCHGVSGMGSPGGAPEMPGVVGKFLTVDGGRAYLASVPGVANAPLNDSELADLLNWMLDRFACGSIPSDFIEYNSEEVTAYRRKVLITTAHEVRAALIEEIDSSTLADAEGCSLAQ